MVGMHRGRITTGPEKRATPTVWESIADLPTASYDAVAAGRTHYPYLGPAQSRVRSHAARQET